MRITHQPTYVLLTRPYSESSWIVEIVTQNYGRMALLAKGARRAKSRLKGVLLPLQPLLLSWSGKGEIPTLTQAELDFTSHDSIFTVLEGDALLCGFYCNELLSKFTHRHDPHPTLFEYYHHTVARLSQAQDKAALLPILRYFELALLRHCGYGANFQYDAYRNQTIQEESYYYYRHGVGFILCDARKSNAVCGKIVLYLAQYQRDDALPDITLSPQQHRQVKHLMRDILHQVLGHNRIVSRDLFAPM